MRTRSVSFYLIDHRFQCNKLTSLRTVLGGQKITGADVREQNGMSNY